MVTDTFWHLSKSVPISVVLILFLQTIGVVIWAVKLDARVTILEASDQAQIIRMARLEEAAAKLAIIEERQNRVIVTLERNGEKIDVLSKFLRDGVR